MKCEDREWKVSRAVVSAGSKFFKGVFGSGLRESQTKEVMIEEEDPESVDKLLKFLYDPGCE